MNVVQVVNECLNTTMRLILTFKPGAASSVAHILDLQEKGLIELGPKAIALLVKVFKTGAFEEKRRILITLTPNFKEWWSSTLIQTLASSQLGTFLESIKVAPPKST